MTYDRRKYDGMTIEQKLDTALEILDAIADAFPDGPLKHRQAHEAWIAAKSAETKFWQDLKLDLAKKGTWAVFVVLVGLLMVGFSAKFGAMFR